MKSYKWCEEDSPQWGCWGQRWWSSGKRGPPVVCPTHNPCSPRSPEIYQKLEFTKDLPDATCPSDKPSFNCFPLNLSSSQDHLSPQFSAFKGKLLHPTNPCLDLMFSLNFNRHLTWSSPQANLDITMVFSYSQVFTYFLWQRHVDFQTCPLSPCFHFNKMWLSSFI